MRPSLAVFALVACSNAADPGSPDASRAIDASTVDSPPIDAAPALRILVINEVAAGEAPDWIEVFNATSAAVELSEFVYVDAAGDFLKARAFPAMTLGPGEYFAQDIDDTVSGFKLGSDEEVHVYRAADQALSDAVDWAEGAAPTGMSFRRVPDRTGDFATGAQSKGAANP